MRAALVVYFELNGYLLAASFIYLMNRTTFISPRLAARPAHLNET